MSDDLVERLRGINWSRSSYDLRREAAAEIERLRAALAEARATKSGFQIGDKVSKTKGSSWRGSVVGHYSTSLTDDGVCVESEHEPGSVQIYPAAALARIGGGEK